MDDLIFNKSCTKLNEEYKKIFNVVPCKQYFSCNREEYIEGLKEAIRTKTKIENILFLVGNPKDKNSLI